MLEYFKEEIQKYSTKYKIDPAIIKAIIMQESAWQRFATRYESTYRWLYNPESFRSGWISLATEVNAQKTSWGLGQIMGALAREQGHKGFLGELLSPATNIKHICIRVAYLEKKCNSTEEIFSAYNGGLGAIHKANGRFKNESYVGSAMSHLIKYQGS